MDAGFRLSRRKFVELSALAAAGSFGLASASGGRALGFDGVSSGDRGSSRDPADIVRRLLDGNRRFVRGETVNPRRKPADFGRLVEGQKPKAVIVGCADSRVSPELLFDQGIGDLFVVRVAGNVVSGAGAIVKGSIEYAVAELGVSLVMVLGHSQCGAVKAALQHIDAGDALPGAINGLVMTIRTAVAPVQGQPGDRLENAIAANVKFGVKRLNRLEPILAPAVAHHKLKVVGAVYDLGTGRVTITER